MRRSVVILAGLSTATRAAATALAALPDVPVRLFADLPGLAPLLVGGAVGPLHALVVDFCRHPADAARAVEAARRSHFYSVTPIVGLARGEAQARMAYDAGAQSVVVLSGTREDAPRLVSAVRYWAELNRVPPQAQRQA